MYYNFCILNEFILSNTYALCIMGCTTKIINANNVFSYCTQIVVCKLMNKKSILIISFLKSMLRTSSYKLIILK